MSQGPQIEVPYPPPNGGQQGLDTLVAFVHPSITFITESKLTSTALTFFKADAAEFQLLNLHKKVPFAQIYKLRTNQLKSSQTVPQIGQRPVLFLTLST